MPRVPSGVTPKQRVFQNPKYKENYYASEDNKLLFCKACESPVDHSRPKSLEDHLKTAKHERAVKRKQERNLSQRRQGTLEGAATAAANRNDVTQDFVAMMTEADIPIDKTEKMQPFMRKHCRSGGSIPGSDSLRKYHLPKVYAEHITKIRANISDKKVYIAVDETTDDRGESVMNIIVGEYKRLLYFN